MPLRLKSLELQGYKTFASHVVFEFAQGITAIVGPNGSGKSNIADALRWVLGEQSYSLLRAKKTEDMIFAGSEHRPRAGMASATVLFDNSDGWLPVDFTEVALTRRAYRDGRNDYLLNGHHVRLRDINELLARSGLSERTYTILGQGLVDASLALKADERRRLFEEAAGVGLYRARREEALHRLETTRRNLERVLDIMAELEPRIRSLERQARRAIEYAQAQADLRVLLRDWYGYHWHRAQAELAEAREAVRQQEMRVREARALYQQHTGESTTFRERVLELRGRLNAWHRQAADLHARRETVSRELAVLEERRRALQASRQDLLLERDRLADEARLADERLSEARAEVERLRAEAEAARQELSTAQAALQGRMSERAAAESRLLEARQLLDSTGARRAELQARLEELRSRMQVQQQRLEAAGESIRKAQAALREAEARAQCARQERERAEAAFQQAESTLVEHAARVESLEQSRRQKQEERAARQAEQLRFTTQLEVLEQAEQSLAGYAEGARFLLDAARQARLSGARGALSAALDVPAEFETAVAAALGEYLDAIIVEGEAAADQALDLIESGAAGRAALLPLDQLTGAARPEPLRDPGFLGVAADLVRVPDSLRPAVDLLLGSVLIVRDRAAARRLVRGQPAHVRAVSLRGEVFRADGAVLAGVQARGGALGRLRQKRELMETLAGLAEGLKTLDVALAGVNSELEAARAERAERERDLQAARAALEAARSEEQRLLLELESARRQADWQSAQHEQLKNEAAGAQAESEQAAQALAETERAHASAGETIRALSGVVAGLTLDELQQQVTYWNARAAVGERGLADAQARLAERELARARLEEQTRDLERRLEQADQALGELDRQKEAQRELEAALHRDLEALRVQTEPAEAELERAEQEELQIQEREANSQRALTAIERMYAQVQLDAARRQESLDSLRQRIMDDFGLVMFEYASDVSGPVPLPFEGMVEQLNRVTELPPGLEEQLAQQRARLRRMGPANPEAKTEYETEKQRYEFMKTQLEDLNKAEADLRKVIAELDELTKQEFQKTFQAVDRQFRDIFVRLFGGGSARLTLTDPDNLVETGIEIEARLPGRREQGLALLSGGERSLTAIALVFALLKVSPTPVCVMDEVDAMLDEANVGRFRDLLAELSKQTQFVVITHNRNTVQAADVIYGVTMGRDSASQVISLRLDEVSDEMLARSA